MSRLSGSACKASAVLAGLVVALGSSLAACGSEPTASPREAEQDEANADDGDVTPRDAGRAPGKDAGRDAGRDSGREEQTQMPPLETEPTCAGITKTAAAIRGKVDVIWLVDNSPSMLDKVLQVASNLNSFFTTIESSGVDTHVVMMTIADPAAGTPLAMDPSKYRFVTANVWSALVYATATTSYSLYEDFLRPDAATHVVVVTDDNDVIGPADFAQQFEQQLGHDFTLHAIVADQFGCGAQVGQNYLTLADQTMGQKISICSQDWTQVFGELESAVIEAAPLPCSYDLADAAKSADDYDSSAVQVKYTAEGSDKSQELPKASALDKCADKQGWYYDDELDPKLISLCPSACTLAQQGGAMDIAFGCKPTIFL